MLSRRAWLFGVLTSAICTRAVRDGDHDVLNGSTMFMTKGATADLFFLAPRWSQAPGTSATAASRYSWPSATAPGFGAGRSLDKMGMRASDTAELSFQDMRVPAEHLRGGQEVGFYEVMRVFQRERLVAGLRAGAWPSGSWRTRWPTSESARHAAACCRTSRWCAASWLTWPPRSRLVAG